MWFSANLVTVRVGGLIQECLQESWWVSSSFAINGLFSFATWISAMFRLMLSQFLSSRKATWHFRILPIMLCSRSWCIHIYSFNVLKTFQENQCGKATSSKLRNDKQLTKRKSVVILLGVDAGWLEIFVALSTMIPHKLTRWFGLIIQISEESHPNQGWRCLETILALIGVVFSPLWCQGHSFTPTNLVCTPFTKDGVGRESLKIFSGF